MHTSNQNVASPKFSITLLRPEIPHNTGAIGRLAVGLGVKLNLVRPLGFRLDDESIRRAGLDYWPHLDCKVHDTWDDYILSEAPKRTFFLSTKGEKSLYDIKFEPGDALVFGNESSGLPADFYERYRDRLFRIPMPGEYARSINLANAVSIAAYECHRQLSAGKTAAAETSWTVSGKCVVPEAWRRHIGHTFTHYKGKKYKLIGFAPHSETLEPMAVYQLLYGDFGLWIRPAKMFFETIDADGRQIPRFSPDETL
jgi:tRNA (cytidine/uridine-2'-O-)-methyltransferase